MQPDAVNPCWVQCFCIVGGPAAGMCWNGIHWICPNHEGQATMNSPGLRRSLPRTRDEDFGSWSGAANKSTLNRAGFFTSFSFCDSLRREEIVGFCPPWVGCCCYVAALKRRSLFLLGSLALAPFTRIFTATCPPWEWCDFIFS